MLPFGVPLPDSTVHPWRSQLDRFVQEHKTALAALAWGLRQEWQDPQQYLGLDLQPTPHFICCPTEALETLNQRLDRQIQEILGLLQGHDPETEVAIVAIAQGQLKLLYFQPDPQPALCFEQHNRDLDALITQLESTLGRLITLD